MSSFSFVNGLKKFALEQPATLDPQLRGNEKEVAKKYRYFRMRMFYSMYIGYVVFYLTRKNLSPVLHVFSKEMNIDIVELGILGSVFYTTYGVGKFLSGAFADRSNIRFFMPVGLLLASITNLFFPHFTSLWLLTFFWGLNGIFQSMGFPPVAKGLVYWFSSKERATKWTLWSSSHTCGTFLVGVLVAFLIKYFGWKMAFYVPGVIGVLTSFWLFERLRDRPVSLGLPTIEDFSKEPPPLKIGDNEKLTQMEILKKYVFTNYHIWSLAIAYIFIYLIRFGTLDWATLFLYDERGVDKVQVAFMWSFMPLLGMPGGIVAGWIADRYFQGRCTPINVIYLILLGLCIWGLYVYASMEHFYLTCFFLAGIGFFVDGPQNLVGGVQVSRVTVSEACSAACGFVGLFGYLGAILSGAGLAYITKIWGWGGMFSFCILSAVLSILLVLISYKREFSQFQTDQR